jgi:hypothetical protein
MIGHFMGMMNAPVGQTLAAFGNDPSIVLAVFNRSRPPTPVSPVPLMIPPPESPIHLNHEPITPTDPIPTYSRPPSYPLTPSDYFTVKSVGHIPSHPPTPDVAEAQTLEEVLGAIEIATTVALIQSDVEVRPGVRPDQSWRHNFEEPGYHFFKLIPDITGQLHIAPFVCIDLSALNPQLLITNGHNCLVHSRPLHMRPKEEAHATYDHRQNFLFTESQLHSPAVDWALSQEQDFTLEAEVV